MDNATDDADEDYEDSTDTVGEPKEGPDSTIDSIEGRRDLPFSVPVVVAVFLVLYFTSILDVLVGISGPTAALDSGMKLLVSTFLAFGAGVFYDYWF